jgi:hypothetical protein
MLSKTIDARTYTYIPTQSCLKIEISASTHDQPDVIASEPFCLGRESTIVRRKRQIVRQRHEIQHELFSFPLARTTPCVQKKTRERKETALYVCYETPSAQREPPLAKLETACETIESSAGYSCCAQLCVRALGGKQGYLVSIIIGTNTIAHDLDTQNEQALNGRHT